MSETDTASQPVLSYEELRAMAVPPSEPGAYSHSPLGEAIGVHVHSQAPGTDVHVYVAGYGKIAEVWPDHTSLLAQRKHLPPAGQAVLGRLPARILS